MKRILFIDRDGTILVEPPDEQIDSFDKMAFLPGVLSGLAELSRETDFELVMVTNQDGLGTDPFPEDTFWPVHNLMLKILESEGIVFNAIYIDRSLPADNSPSRKPGTEMLKKYMTGKYDLANSYVIGDRESDIKLAQNLNSRAIYFNKKSHSYAKLCTTNWHEISAFLKYPPRESKITRKTHETDIEIAINLDGQGRIQVNSGLGFLDHMLELFAKHSLIDINAKIDGDLHVDEHHTVEDTAIVLGSALINALGDKKGIFRYGFLLPMDEAHAYAAVDFCGRSNLVWKTKFRRTNIGDMPSELFRHFFKSFCDHAKCSLYIKAKGKNEHHKIEAIFKAVARAIRFAIDRDPRSDTIPSTKGIL